MNLHYKIIEVAPQQHSIVVRFYTDHVTEEMLANQWAEDGSILRGRTDYNIDLPIPAPQGAELDAFLQAKARQVAPWLQTMEAVLDPAVDTSLSHIHPLVGQVSTLTL